MRSRTLLAAAAIGGAAAFLLGGYEFLRSVSQSLYIASFGANRLPIVMALAPVGTLAFIWGYGRLLSLGGARRAMVFTCLASAGGMVGCHAGLVAGHRMAAGALYVLREAYVVLLVEQVWAFINSTVRVNEGARLNGPICGVASIGAIAGGLAVKSLAVRVGSENLLLLGALSLAPTALLALAAYAVGGEPRPEPGEAGGRRGHLGVRTLFHDRLLSGLALVVMASQVVSTVFDLQVSRYVEIALPGRDLRTEWFGGFYAALNAGSAVCQFVLAPLLLAVAPLRLIHAAVPAVHATLGVLSLIFPSLRAAAMALGAFKVLDYSVFRAAKELLYVPLSFDARYRAKELIDAFGYRLAKGGTSAALAVAGGFVAVPCAALAAGGVAASAVWIGLVAAFFGRPTPGDSNAHYGARWPDGRIRSS